MDAFFIWIIIASNVACITAVDDDDASFIRAKMEFIIPRNVIHSQMKKKGSKAMSLLEKIKNLSRETEKVERRFGVLQNNNSTIAENFAALDKKLLKITKIQYQRAGV